MKLLMYLIISTLVAAKLNDDQDSKEMLSIVDGRGTLALVWRIEQILNRFRNIDSNFKLRYSQSLIANKSTSFEKSNPLVSNYAPFRTLDNLEAFVLVAATITWQDEHQQGCHHFFLTLDSQNLFASLMIRYSFLSHHTIQLMDFRRLRPPLIEKFLKDHSGDLKTICRTILIEMADDDDDDLFRFLEAWKLWLWPKSRVVLVGPWWKASRALQHPALRNTIQPLFLAFPQGPSKAVSVYYRCLYCENGEAQVRTLRLWSEDSKTINGLKNLLFPNNINNFHGHLLRVVTMSYFPYIDYMPDNAKPGTAVVHRDCLDKRMFDTISAHLNLSFEVRLPEDRVISGQITKNGNFTGMMGAIQYEEADVTSSIIVIPSRLKILDLVRTCTPDTIIIVSSKPSLIPQYLVITKPLKVEVLLYSLVSVIVVGICFWGLQICISRLDGQRSIGFGDALLYSWAVFLQNSSLLRLPITAGQILKGFWVLATLLIATAFKSALVAHLTILSKTTPIDSFEDLIPLKNWGYGLEKPLLKGAFGHTLRNTPIIANNFYQFIEGVDINEGLRRVQEGRFVIFSSLNRVTSVIGANYTDSKGRTHFHISKQKYRMTSDFGIGVRKGAPFHQRLSQVISRLVDTGIIAYWIQDVMKTRIKQVRNEVQQSLDQRSKEIAMSQDSQQFSAYQDSETAISTTHLMGVFLIFLLGFIVSTLAFSAEILFKGSFENF